MNRTWLVIALVALVATASAAHAWTSRSTVSGEGTANHSHVGAQASGGVNFTLFGRGAFVEADAVKLFAPGPGITWIPLRLGIRI